MHVTTLLAEAMVDAEAIRHLLQKAVLDPVPRQFVSGAARVLEVVGFGSKASLQPSYSLRAQALTASNLHCHSLHPVRKRLLLKCFVIRKVKCVDFLQ